MSGDTATAVWKCDVCGREFSRKQGLGRHMHETHGTPTTRQVGRDAPAAQAKSAQTSSMLGEVERELHELLAPLRKRLAKLNADIGNRTAELVELRKARTYIEGTIRKLEPAPKANSATSDRGAKGARAAAEYGYRRKLANTREYLIANASTLRDGFTVQSLTEAMKRDGVTPVASNTKVAQILDDLRDQGVVRADRVTRGGGMSWLVVQTTNGTTGGTDGTAQT